MRKVALGLCVGLGMAALAAPAAAGDLDFFLKFDGITSEGGKPDGKSGQQWARATSWFWGEYEAPEGAPKVEAKLQKQGYFDRGNVRVAGSFAGCEVGKTAPEAVLKTPMMSYTFHDVVITKCKPTSVTFNYGKIRSRAN